jgi:ketosteroid isomerase-like protein
VTRTQDRDLVRSIYAASERGDYSDASWADPEIDYVVVDGPEPSAFKGHAGLAEAMRQTLPAWDRFVAHVDEYRELDTERVLVLLHMSGRGKAGGLELSALRDRGAQAVHIRKGKVTRIAVYFDRDRAFADLGLEE